MKTESLSRFKSSISHDPITIFRRRNSQNGMIGGEHQYKNIVEAMGNGISEIDHKGVSTYANDTICELWGYRRGDIIGRKVSDFLDQTNSEILNKQLNKRKSGGCESYELTWTRKNGQKVHTIMTPTPYFESSGRFLGSFAIITDISSLKSREQSLITAKEQLESKLEKCLADIIMKSQELNDVNTALKVLLRLRETDRSELEKNMILTVKELISPYLLKLQNGRLNKNDKEILWLVEMTLDDILSPLARRLGSKWLNLTPLEIQIANLIKHGKNTKEAASILNLSVQTIKTYRNRIRKKLGIANTKYNLRSFLLSLGE